MALLLPDCTSKRKSTTGDRDRMTRIGFAYNQKPEDSIEIEGHVVSPLSSNGSLSPELSSFTRDSGTRAGRNGGVAVSDVGFSRTPTLPHADDAYAEWDSPETIAAV